MPKAKPLVAVVMGSRSDLAVMEDTRRVLDEFGVPHETRVLSAHRTPAEAAEFFSGAEARGVKVVVCAAGGAAHLAGAAAAHTTLPVVAVPLAGSPLQGWDALLSSVMMPPGIPVATVAVGPWGARNAAYLAVAVLALGDAGLRRKLHAFRAAQRAKILQDSVIG
jgi:phosphoribosylaminoimidazole carboxylase PurE protein